MKHLIFLFLATFGFAESFNELVFALRDPKTPPHQFRECLNQLGQTLAMSIANNLSTEEVEIQTITKAFARHAIPIDQPVLVTILRAGLPLTMGALQVFEGAEVGFLGMARNEHTLKAETTYISLPELKDRLVILIDTMLATGGSFLDAIELLKARGAKEIIILAAIASQQGIERIYSKYPETKFYLGAVDPELNRQGYIVPGLGDAGDRCFGIKGSFP